MLEYCLFCPNETEFVTTKYSLGICEDWSCGNRLYKVFPKLNVVPRDVDPEDFGDVEENY